MKIFFFPFFLSGLFFVLFFINYNIYIYIYIYFFFFVWFVFCFVFYKL